MSKAKQQRRKQIKAELAMGKQRFVVHRGLISWALPTYILYLGINVLVFSLFYRLTFLQSVGLLFPLPVLTGLVLFTIAGVFMGKYRWKQLLKEAGGKYRSGKKGKDK